MYEVTFKALQKGHEEYQKSHAAGGAEGGGRGRGARTSAVPDGAPAGTRELYIIAAPAPHDGKLCEGHVLMKAVGARPSPPIATA